MNTNIRDHLNETLRSQTSTLTGTQDDFALDGPFSYLKLNNASALTITGALVDSGNIDGSRVIFEALNSTVTLSHQSTGSSSANRFINDTGADIILGAGERANLFYDTANTRWRVGKASTGAIAQTVGAKNLFPDPYVVMWPAGDAAAPAGATLTQDGNSALARNTTTYLYGGMAPELKLGTTATVSSTLKWVLFSSIPASWKGKTIGIGAAVYSATGSLGRLQIQDGGTGGTTSSAYHTGGSTWEWISFTHTIASDATKLEIYLEGNIGGQGVAEVSAIFDGISITKGPSPPTDVVMPVTVGGRLHFGVITGNVATNTDQFNFDATQPWLVTNVSLRAGTGPTGAALIVDGNHWDGTVWQTMYSTRPQIAAAATEGGADPDGTYRYRCFKGRKDTDSLTDGLFNVDIDQVGSTLTGADLQVDVAILQFQDQLAAER